MVGGTWRDIPGYETLYQVSSLGRIKSLSRIDPLGRVREGKILRSYPDRNGYLRVRLSKGGTVSNLTVHRLVCEVFHGSPPLGKELALHGAEGVSVNTPNNLSWGTSSENARHRRRDGTDWKALQTECLRGHEFSERNTYIKSTGQRACRACRAIRSRASYHRKKEKQ